MSLTTQKRLGGDFFDSENHIYINKLNHICKNYDTAFKDVRKTKKLLDDDVLPEIEKQRLAVNDVADRIEYNQHKLLTIEKHLPSMI